MFNKDFFKMIKNKKSGELCFAIYIYTMKRSLQTFLEGLYSVFLLRADLLNIPELT